MLSFASAAPLHDACGSMASARLFGRESGLFRAINDNRPGKRLLSGAMRSI
jgi:hypothetical protein